MEPWWREAWAAAGRSAFSRRELAVSGSVGAGTWIATWATGTRWWISLLIGVGTVAVAAVMLPGLVFAGSAVTYRTRRLHRRITEIAEAVASLSAAPQSSAGPGGPARYTITQPKPPRNLRGTFLQLVSDLEYAHTVIDAAAWTELYTPGVLLITTRWDECQDELVERLTAEQFEALAAGFNEMRRFNDMRSAQEASGIGLEVHQPDDLNASLRKIQAAKALLQGLAGD